MSLLVVGALHWDVVVTADRLPRIDETLRGKAVDYRLRGRPERWWPLPDASVRMHQARR
jgi:hypothetical protein